MDYITIVKLFIENEILKKRCRFINGEYSESVPNFDQFKEQKKGTISFHIQTSNVINCDLDDNFADLAGIKPEKLLRLIDFTRYLGISPAQLDASNKYIFISKTIDSKEVVISSHVHGIKIVFNLFLLENQIQNNQITLESRVSDSIFNAFTDAVLLLDNNKRIVKYNKTAEQYFKNISGTLLELNEPLEKYVSINQKEQFIQDTNKALDNKKIINQGVAITSNGRQSYFESILVPISLNTNKVDYLLTTFKNVTSNKIIEKRYYETKIKSDESYKLKRAFLTNMSHEIRTPMNGIIGFSELLQKPNISEEKRAKYTKLIHSNGKTLLEVFEEILDVARIETGEMIENSTTFNINKLFDDMHFYCNNNFRSEEDVNIEIQVEKQFPDIQVTVTTDRGKIRQVLLNFLSNSFKNTKSGIIKFGYKLKESSIEIYVSDSGAGLSDNKSELIEDYLSSDENVQYINSKEGNSLTSIKGYIDFMKGDIEFTSQEGIGSYFSVDIPVVYESIPQAEDIIEQASIYIPTEIKGFINNQLESFKGNIIKYNSRHLNFENKNGQVLYLFYNLTRLSDLLNKIEELTKQNEQAKFIYVSNHANEEEKAICYSFGCHGYVTADVQKDYFQKLIQTLIE